MKLKKTHFALIAFIVFAFSTKILCAGEGDVLWKTNIGGTHNDNFTALAALSDGFVAVGYSDFASFGSGTWTGCTGNGDMDAVIVKYDYRDSIVWKKKFGGLGADYFESVTVIADGIIAVGSSNYISFENGDWLEVESKGLQDAIIVKFDNAGNVVWKKNFGGKNNGYTSFISVISIEDGIIVAGYSDGFGAGDWEEFTGNGNEDAIMVKYDLEGNIVWKTHFGGSDVDRFFSLSTATDGIVAVGVSFAGSFENGNWETDTCKGGKDAIMVKFDQDGNVLWQTNFGGKSDDFYYAATTVSDGFVAAGISFPNSFKTGDWEADTCKGYEDAIIVKYDEEGNVVWKNNFGGDGWDCFYDLISVPNAIIVVGSSDRFGSGDWKNINGKGSKDAIIVKLDNTGNVLWKRNFGGNDADEYKAVSVVANAVTVVGYSSFNSFKTGDWNSIEGKGWEDAIVVKYAAGVLDMDELSNSHSQLRVYPNPTTGILRIENGELKMVNVEVFDIYGRKLSSHPIPISSYEHAIDVSYLPSGIYFLRMAAETVKFVKY